MAHVDDSELALFAAGSHVGAESQAHFEQCEQCRAEIDEWRDALADPSTADLPGPHVWGAIHASLDLGDDVKGDPLRDVIVAPRPVAAARRPRRGRGWMLAAAAVVIAAAGVVGGMMLSGLSSVPDSSVVAQARLAPLPGWTESGTASVEQDAGGHRVLVIDLPGEVPEGELREVWMIRTDLSGLVSMGLLDGDAGRFTIPQGLDLTQFDVVDVSAEPLNGDPSHSGASIVRGTLEFA